MFCERKAILSHDGTRHCDLDHTTFSGKGRRSTLALFRERTVLLASESAGPSKVLQSRCDRSPGSERPSGVCRLILLPVPAARSGEAPPHPVDPGRYSEGSLHRNRISGKNRRQGRNAVMQSTGDSERDTRETARKAITGTRCKCRSWKRAQAILHQLNPRAATHRARSLSHSVAIADFNR